MTNRQILLKSRPPGMPNVDNFEPVDPVSKRDFDDVSDMPSEQSRAERRTVRDLTRGGPCGEGGHHPVVACEAGCQVEHRHPLPDLHLAVARRRVLCSSLAHHGTKTRHRAEYLPSGAHPNTAAARPDLYGWMRPRRIA